MITLRDLAARAGVSTAAASYALNGSGRISERTRQRVLKAAEEIGYQPSTAARALKGVRTRVAGIYMDEVSGAYYGEIISGAQSRLSEAGYGMISGSMDPASQKLTYGLIKDAWISGLIILNPEAAELKFLESLHAQVPCVLLDAGPCYPDFPRVAIENQKGISILMRRLIARGRHKFVYIDGADKSWDARERLQAFASSLEQGGFELKPEMILRAGYHTELAYSEMSRYIEENGAPDAVVCGSDTMALGAMRALREAGLGLPADVSVTGFDDILSAAYMIPSLTSVRIDRRALGRRLAEKLIVLMDHPAGGDAEQVPEGFPVDPVIRESCGT